MAQGIIIILGGTSATDGTVLNTILHSISDGMQNFPPVISAWFMYIFQSVFNFFVVSGSGQAALTMPIMAPLADLVGVERQVAVVAYQLGDAFTNFIVPTSGCLLGALAAAKLDWGKWAKFQIKFQAVLFAFGSIAVIPCRCDRSLHKTGLPSVSISSEAHSDITQTPYHPRDFDRG